MAATADPVTLTIPRTVLSAMLSLSADLTDRMHELLERNTDGQLNSAERRELDILVQVAEFGQIISTALNGQSSR